MRHAALMGLIPEAEDEGTDFHKIAAHALSMRIARKSSGPADGLDRTLPETPKDAYYGIRWKTTIPDQYLQESDRILVMRYREDPSFGEHFLNQDEAERQDQPSSTTVARGSRRFWLWPLMAAVVALSLLLGLLLSRNQDETQALIKAGDIAELRARLRDTTRVDVHDRLIEAIAATHERLGHGVPVLEGIEELTAVFAFERDPALIFGFHLLRPGDRLTLADDHGYLQEIQTTGLVIHTERGLRTIPYPEMKLFGETNWATPPVLIYPGNGMLYPVLQQACLLGGYELETDELPGALAGAYGCDSYGAFIERVAPSLGLRLEGGKLRAAAEQGDPLPSCIGFDRFFPYVETSVGAALDEYQRLLHVNLIIHSKRLDKMILLPPTQFSAFLSELNFQVKPLGPNLVEVRDAS